MKKPLALVVEDEPDIATLYEMGLERFGVRALCVGSVKEALAALANPHDVGFCITDLRLPDGSGLDVVRHIQTQSMEVPVAVVTAYGDVEAATGALKAGAFDFVTKPISLPRLKELVEHALRLKPILAVMDDLAAIGTGTLVGNSLPMQGLRKLVGKVARTQAPVFIHGESGTGKELIARRIHHQGPRTAAPFVPVNCGAMPPDLIESELFGHRKGSFTGAVSDKPGLFRAAHGGTLFLDEVAELPLPVQVKLLRVLQERAVRPVGAVEEEAVDVRVLSASHKNLAELVQVGKFRHDLFYRLNVIQIDVPPLRVRADDIPLLVNSILQRLAERDGIPVPSLSLDALQALQAYDFPGNVRELENLLERCVALSDGGVLDAEHLMLDAARPFSTEFRPSVFPEMHETTSGEPSTAQILQVLEAHRWNRTRAAEALGMTLRQLRYRLAKLQG